jgi:hypothetical protein
LPKVAIHKWHKELEKRRGILSDLQQLKQFLLACLKKSLLLL